MHKAAPRTRRQASRGSSSGRVPCGLRKLRQKPEDRRTLGNYSNESAPLSSLWRFSIPVCMFTFQACSPPTCKTDFLLFLGQSPQLDGHLLLSLTFMPLPTQSPQCELTSFSFYSKLLSFQGPCLPDCARFKCPSWNSRNSHSCATPFIPHFIPISHCFPNFTSYTTTK